MEAYAEGYLRSFRGKKLKPLHSIPVDLFLDYTKVVGAFKNGKMVGGYALNFEPVRCFEEISESDQLEWTRKLGGKDQICELVAIWKASELHKREFVAVWTQLVLDSIKMKRKFILGCSYQGHGMSKKYKVMTPLVIKQGVHPNDLTVFVYRRIQFFGTFLLCLIQYWMVGASHVVGLFLSPRRLVRQKIER